MSTRLGLFGVTASAVLAFGLAAGSAAVAQRAAPPVQAAAATSAHVDNFMLVDAVNMEAYELYRLADAKAVVLVTQVNGDPVLGRELPALKALKAAYANGGVEFMLVNSSLKDSREAIAAEAARAGYDTPVLMDSYQLVGESLGVTRSAEVIVIDPKTWQVAYRGALGDGGAEKVVAQLTAGQPAVQTLASAGLGDLVDFPARSRKVEISYANDVAPILEKNCVGCHSEGGIGPFAMKDYATVKGFSPMIREVIRTDRMPPYNADPHVGKFSDNKNLSPAEITTLVHWIEQGAPRGEGADPLAAKRQVAAEWPLGKPDLILKVPAYKIPASGTIEWQRPYVLNTEKEGHWLRATAVKPGDRQGVHHVLTGWMTDAPKNGVASEQNWKGSVGRYAVGSEADLYDNDVGAYLPAGGAVGFQMHYTPYGKASVDNTEIGLYFADHAPEHIMRQVAISDPTIDIPPGAPYHKETAYLEFPKDALMYSAFVHAHYRATASDLWIQYPDGKKKLLLSLPRYDFNWQRAYRFAQPVKVPAGAKLIADYWYDNSKRNPHNPDPKIHVTWGEQSSQEMLFTQLEFRWMDETASHQIDSDGRFLQGRLMGFIDKNLDGKVEKSELRGQIGKMLAAQWDAIDVNHDGVIDKAELAAGQSKLSMFGRRRNAAEEFNGPGEPSPAPTAAKPAG